MNAFEFLELLLPTTGVIFTASPTGKGWANKSHKTLSGAIEHVNYLTFSGQNAYFALATYEKERVWDAAFQDATGKTVGKWRTRTQANAQFIKSFFLDLDVDPEDEKKFTSKGDALAGLREFVTKIGLPRPMLVDSGGGIHAYWPLHTAVPTAQWREVADKFKAICVSERFRADRSLTSDQARVLRVLGGYNYKRGSSVKLLSPAPRAVGFDEFTNIIEGYIAQHGINAPLSKAPAIPGAPISMFEQGNLGATNDPLNFDRILFSCAQLQTQVAVRGAGIGEQLWRAGLGIVKFCEPMEPAWRAISDGHPGFDPVATVNKINNWKTGPTACEHFHQLDPVRCEACPHWQKLTSPAQLGHMTIAAAAPEISVVDEAGVEVLIALPDPPSPYIRRKSDSAILLEVDGMDETPNAVPQVVCNYDLYPLALRSQTGVDASIDERSMWRVHLPLEKGQGRAPRDIDVPLGLMSDLRGLSKLLFSKGIIMHGEQPKLTQHYMSAYLQKLAMEAGREKLYDRLGWHDEHTAFVMGDCVLRRDGSVQANVPSNAIRNTTRGGLKTMGTLAGWKEAMQFYNRPGYEGHRFFLYASLGAPIFHMNDTGNKGVLITASGQSGRGKTTCLKACGSLWGHPEALILNGNKDGSTINALYSAIGTIHSMPFMWDDITERDPDELRRFLLNISQGQGKRRMTADSTQSGHMDTWETLVLASANTDDFSRIMSTGRDVSPHLMRMVGVEFASIDTGAESKIKADAFLRAITQNYGHVGPAMMKIIVQRYDSVRNGYIKNVAMVDRLLGSANASAERYWSATVAAAYTGAQLAQKMGLIDFPYEADLKWMIAHLNNQRDAISESSSNPMEMLTSFLNAHLRDTLILSAKAASNLDNVAHAPGAELIVRNELDSGVLYISRTAIMTFCAEHRVAFKAFETELEQSRVILSRNAQKVLGADTIYASGQTRCWKVDATKLNGLVTPQVPPAPAVSLPSNVVPLKVAR